ncbi:MAG: helix-turn-helix domain-containing protein [Clostridium sp.]|uniref:helix-turn-helix domain-containing protein n=1 Tax=Clostridium sp. TaxID=1506 RepID=UPI001EC6BFAC|nr:helix-turn-helix domain-containing protein [Clostridium sp.]MBS5883849.1 helix-turn-helix domain-containing protein [Clostridium sp.]MDU7147452.1 helix-turn-helix domain-containing protein [Clostridium sp.]MDU7240568.1 helix-turn-helix domain-containing protein [Clostridium sp.]
MLKEKLLPISIFSLAISLIISASIIANSMENNGRFIGDGISQGIFNLSNSVSQKENNYTYEQFKDVLSLYEASEYLGISQDQLRQVIQEDESIPYVQIYGQLIFSKNAIDKWVETSKFKM